MRKIADSNHFQFINNNHSYYYKDKEHVDEKNEFDVLLELNDTHKKAVKYKGEFWNYVTLVDDKHTQGWKIHISSTIENYLRLFYLVCKYCISQNINFKYIKNMKMYRLSHDKSYSRETAGNKLNLDIARRLASNFYLYEDRVKKGLYAGEQLIRLSNDYFTGSIGVTSTLARLYEINTHNDCNQNFFLDQYYMNLGSEVYEK